MTIRFDKEVHDALSLVARMHGNSFQTELTMAVIQYLHHLREDPDFQKELAEHQKQALSVFRGLTKDD